MVRTAGRGQAAAALLRPPLRSAGRSYVSRRTRSRSSGAASSWFPLGPQPPRAPPPGSAAPPGMAAAQGRSALAPAQGCSGARRRGELLGGPGPGAQAVKHGDGGAHACGAGLGRSRCGVAGRLAASPCSGASAHSGRLKLTCAPCGASAGLPEGALFAMGQGRRRASILQAARVSTPSHAWLALVK